MHQRVNLAAALERYHDPSSIVRYDIFNVRFDVNLAITLNIKQ